MIRDARVHLRGLAALLCLLPFLFPCPANSGPALDEILNYMYVDQGVPMQYRSTFFSVNRTIRLTQSQRIGQVFAAGLETEQIVRIRVFLQPDNNWQPGEGAEMVVYDSPQKQNVLGRYTIWYEFRGYVDCVAEFEVHAPVQPGRTYFFELSYVGTGDGTLVNVGVMNGAYNYDILHRVLFVDHNAPVGGDGSTWAKAYRTITNALNGMDSAIPGQGYLNGQISDFDVCFQSHGKRRMDRTANLKKMFDRMDLTRPELAAVKKDVDKKDYDSAVAKTVAYFEGRPAPLNIITPGYVPNPDPNFDTTDGDMALTNYFWGDTGYGYVGPDINWRAAVQFDSSGHLAASSFDLNRFGPRGTLTKAYLGTGDERYAIKLNDMMLDWFRDNPPPEAAGFGGAPIDSVWASLNTGIRLGHAFTAYDRVHSSLNWTTDCRMAWIMDLADHADTLIWNGGDAGGNWAITQNTSLMTHALNFPEFKNNQLWFDTSESRINGVLVNDFLPDGIETESAPGYQRWMVYNPLVDTHRLLLERNVQTTFSATLMETLEKFAEYFMYLTAPDGGTPEMGDWGGDNQRGFLSGDAALYNRPDMLYVATAGAQGTKPAHTFKLYPNYGTVTMRSHWGDTGEPFDQARWLFFHGVHRGAHGHEDLNSVTCYAYGRELLKDPGAYIYGSSEHDLLTKSESHSMMTVDGQDMGGTNDVPFQNYCGTEVADYVAFNRPNAYTTGDYKREVFFARSNGDAAQDYWIVRDTAYGGGTHNMQQRWHFKPTTVTLNGTTAKTGFSSGGNLAVMQVTPSRLTTQQTTIDSWPSGSGQPAVPLPTVIYTANAALPAAIDTVLFPYNGPTMPAATLQTLESSTNGRASVFKVTQGTVQDLFILQQAAGSKTVSSESVTTNAEHLFLRKVNGVARSALLINGSQLTVNGQQLVNLGSSQPWYSITFGGN